jgi:GTPase
MEKKKRYESSLGYIQPEDDEGNTEYKRKLTDLTPMRLEQVLTQLKWRLSEGCGRATYYIGVDDDGSFYGLTKEQMDTSIKTLTELAEKAHANIVNVEYIPNPSEKLITKINIEKKLINVPEIRIALIGRSGGGKSTLLSVLINNEADDGKGSGRSSICRHVHEYTDGKTSSVNYYEVGLEKDNCDRFTYDKENIKIHITFIDLPGHINYRRTLYHGLLSSRPHYIMIVSDNNNVSEYTALCDFLNLPYIIVLTHCEQMDNKKEDLKNHITDENIKTFRVSNVTKVGIPELTSYITNLVPYKNVYSTTSNKVSIEPKGFLDRVFMVNSVYNIKDRNMIINGILLKGVLSINDILYSEKEEQYKIKSIHRNQQEFNVVNADETASMTVDAINPKINKYTTLVDKSDVYVNSFHIQTNNKLNVSSSNHYTLFANNIDEPIMIVREIDTLKYLCKFYPSIKKYLSSQTRVIIRNNNDNSIVYGISQT